MGAAVVPKLMEDKQAPDEVARGQLEGAGVGEEEGDPPAKR